MMSGAGAGARPTRRRLRVSLIAAVAAGAALAGVAAAGRYVARLSVYPAPADAVGAPPAGIAEIHLPAPAAEVRVAWTGGEAPAIAADAPARAPVLLYLHGNGENLATVARGGTLGRLGRLGGGAAWVALDYPGYGRSTGKPSEPRLVDAAEAALDWIGARYPGRPVVVIGRSLGAAVAVGLAARRADRMAGLVLVAPFSSLTDVAARFYPRWLVGLLVPDRYPSVELAPRIAVPALVIHGDADQLVPAAHGRALCDRLPRCTAFVAVAGAGHNDVLLRDELWRAIAAFVARVTTGAVTAPATRP